MNGGGSPTDNIDYSSMPIPDNSDLTAIVIMNRVPKKLALILADALLFAVYGWTPGKTRKMKLSSVIRWVNLAHKRMTWGDAYKMRMFLEPKRSIWKKIISKINF